MSCEGEASIARNQWQLLTAINSVSQSDIVCFEIVCKGFCDFGVCFEIVCKLFCEFGVVRLIKQLSSAFFNWVFDKMDEEDDFLAGGLYSDNDRPATGGTQAEDVLEEKPDAGPRAKGKGKNNVAKAKAKKEGGRGFRKGMKQASGRAGGAVEEEQRRCTAHCKKMLWPDDFNDDQLECRNCFNEKRRWSRLLCSQKEGDWWDALKANNPRQAQKTMKKFSTHCKTNSPKFKFNILDHKRRLVKASGIRKSGKRKWMWEKEFIEEMATTKHGNMTEEEAKREWAYLLSDTKKQAGQKRTSRHNKAEDLRRRLRVQFQRSGRRRVRRGL